MPNPMTPRFDVITLGETMLRLTPPALRRIEQTQTFDLEIGGSESNTSVGLARMGLKVAWVSRLTDNALGRLIARGIATQGVDVSQVVWTREHRIGVYFLEEGRPPRPSRVIYDRADSAFSHMTPADLPLSLFAPGGARLLHVTGITPALGPTTAGRFWAGLLALALLLAAEFGLVLQLQGGTLAGYLESRDPVSGAVYATMLVAFALMPLIVARTTEERSDDA